MMTGTGFHLPFLQAVLSPLGLILLGGGFVMADVVLMKRRGEAEEVLPFTMIGKRPRAGLRLASVFLFTLSTALATRDLLSLPGGAMAWFVWGALPCLAGGFSLLILFFGILLPRALGEALHEKLFIRGLAKLARWLTVWVDPVADLAWWGVSSLLRILHLSRGRSAQESEDDVLQIMDEGLESGAFERVEKEMVEGVLDLDEQSAAELMTPRSRVTWLDLDEKDEVNWRRIAGAGHSDYPVFEGNHDNVRGMVSVKSLWANVSMTGGVRLRDVITPPLFVPVTMKATVLIEEFRRARRHVALVVDEFGVVEGMVTLKDVVEAIVGRLPERGVRQHYPEIIVREDGSWLLDAQVDFEEAAREIGLEVPEEDPGEKRFQTIGGFVLHHLGHIPEEGEKLLWKTHRFEIVDMDRQRIDKLIITRLPMPGFP